jgi:hypothetical protein
MCILGDIRATPTVCQTGLLFLIFWQKEKKIASTV